jgi:hypothetical protein
MHIADRPAVRVHGVSDVLCCAHELDKPVSNGVGCLSFIALGELVDLIDSVVD